MGTKARNPGNDSAGIPRSDGLCIHLVSAPDIRAYSFEPERLRAQVRTVGRK